MAISPKLADSRSNRSLLQHWYIWAATLVAAYLLSFFWLTGAIVCVPIVLGYAAFGISSLVFPPADPFQPNTQLGPFEIAIHFVFWSLFFLGLFGRRLPAVVLRVIYLLVLIMLLATMRGCALYYHSNTADWH